MENNNNNISDMENNNNISDYVKASQELATLYFSLELEGKRSSPVLTMEGMHEGENPWPHFEYNFTFSPTNTSRKGKFTVKYSCGAGKDEVYKRLPKPDRLPKAQEVFACCCAESIEAHNNNFEDWSNAFGYDTDSRKAKKIYNTCAQQYFQLLMLVSSKNLEKLADLHNIL
jgi:hypothetical protein